MEHDFTQIGLLEIVCQHDTVLYYHKMISDLHSSTLTV